jgi:hypothetical protein
MLIAGDSFTVLMYSVKRMPRRRIYHLARRAGCAQKQQTVRLTPEEDFSAGD